MAHRVDHQSHVMCYYFSNDTNEYPHLILRHRAEVVCNQVKLLKIATCSIRSASRQTPKDCHFGLRLHEHHHQRQSSKMPLYQIQHSSTLSRDQQDKLAAAITEIHAEKFTTPSLFVNVIFTDTSSQHTYVAGKRVCPPSLSLSVLVRH